METVIQNLNEEGEKFEGEEANVEKYSHRGNGVCYNRSLLLLVCQNFLVNIVILANCYCNDLQKNYRGVK